MKDFSRKLLRLFRRNCATTLAFARVLSRATVVTGLASALAFAGILSGTVVLGLLCLLGLGGVVLAEELGAGNQTRSRGSESDGKFSAIHQTASLELICR
jgi:hypothetical protein